MAHVQVEAAVLATRSSLTTVDVLVGTFALFYRVVLPIPHLFELKLNFSFWRSSRVIMGVRHVTNLPLGRRLRE